MTLIRIPLFSGEAPRLAPRKLGPTQATQAVNCRLSSGELTPWASAAPVCPIRLRGPAQCIRILPDGRWLTWPSPVQTAKIPLAEREGRLCITGLDAPRVTEATRAGETGSQPAAQLLGVPAPQTPPVAQPGPGGGGSAPQSRAYVFTFVSSRGEEGPPSPPSSAVHAQNGQSVTVYAMAAPPEGDWDVTARRLYRTATPSQGSALWLFVAEIPVAQEAYTDALNDADLGEQLASEQWLPPPSGLRGILAMPGGFLAGFVGNMVCFSEPYRPHAWPPGYQVSTEHPVTALGLFGSTLVAATTAQPYLLDGAHPAAMSLTRLPESQACVAAAGLAASEFGVVYPAPDGLYAVGSGGGRLITRQLLDRDTWQAMQPQTICAAMHDGRYVAFFRDPEPNPWTWTDVGEAPLGGTIARAAVDTYPVNGSRLTDMDVRKPASIGRGMVLDLTGAESVLTFLDIYASATFSDPESDTLYMAVDDGAHAEGQHVLAFGRGSDPLTYTWRSRTFAAERPINLGAAIVEADFADGPVELIIWADGRERLRRSVVSATPFRLPAGFAAREWVVRLSGSATVKEIRLAGCVSELAT